MLADPVAARQAALGPDGVVAGLSAGKGYVDMRCGARGSPQGSTQLDNGT